MLRIESIVFRGLLISVSIFVHFSRLCRATSILRVEDPILGKMAVQYAELAARYHMSGNLFDAAILFDKKKTAAVPPEKVFIAIILG